MRRFRLLTLAATLLALGPASAQVAGTQSAPPPTHSSDWPQLTTGASPYEANESLKLGPELQRGRPARAMLADHRRLDRALAAIQPQRKGVVDAYVVAVALDSDPVFSREAREAGRVLARRFDATGRSITLAGPDGRAGEALPLGSIGALSLALARIAETMDPAEDVLVLYSTSHGAKLGIAYHDGDEGFGMLSPARLAALLDELKIKRRVLILSACYSGVFIPWLASGDTALLTAASSERTSFGCMAENDWTFFGDAMVNRALRKPQPLAQAAKEAHGLIARWEADGKLLPSDPQLSVGEDVAAWLAPLEARMPRAVTQPVGRPATDALKQD